MSQTYLQNTIFEHQSVISTTSSEVFTKNTFEIIEKKEDLNQNVSEGKFLKNKYNLQNIHSKVKLFIDEKSNYMNENEFIRSERKEEKLNQRLFPDSRSFNNEKNNVVEQTESIHKDINIGNSIFIAPKNHSNMNSQNIHREAGPFIGVKPNFIDENKSISSEEKREKLNRHMLPDNRSFNDDLNNVVDENKPIHKEVINANSESTAPKDRSENNTRTILPEAGPSIGVKPNSIDKNEFVNSGEKHEKLNPYLAPDRRSFNDRKNNVVDKTESIREQVENGKSISGKPEDRSASETSRRDNGNEANSRNPESENEEQRRSETKKTGEERTFTNDRGNSTRFIPKDQWSKSELSSNVTKIENDSKNNPSNTANSGKENGSFEEKGKLSNKTAAAEVVMRKSKSNRDESDSPHGNSEGKRTGDVNGNSADEIRPSGGGNTTNGWADVGKRSNGRTNGSDDGSGNSPNTASAQNPEAAHGNSDAGKGDNGGAETDKRSSDLQAGDEPGKKNNNSSDRVEEPTGSGRNTDVNGTKNSDDGGNSSVTVNVNNGVRAVTVEPQKNGQSSIAPTTTSDNRYPNGSGETSDEEPTTAAGNAAAMTARESSSDEQKLSAATGLKAL